MKIISYNVLSSHLASPSHFKACDPDHLAAETRFTRIKEKLDHEINLLPNNSNETAPRPIICLQEVSQMWAGPFHTYFASHGYNFINGLYGSKFSNYMGIAIAYPTEDYDLVDANIERLSDFRTDGWPRQSPEEIEAKKDGVAFALLKAGYGVLSSMIFNPARSILGFKIEKPPIEEWDFSENRKNIFIFLRLKRKGDTSGTTFCISNYHMPCAYYAPKVMTIHADMVAKRNQDLARSDPYVLAGDFNILPNSSTYRLLTTGALPLDDPSYPSKKYGMTWKPSFRKMRSAYASHPFGEPEFTNYAKPGDSETFIETLDYFFISDEWSVKDVQRLKSKEEVVDGPYPNADEPSDHVLISATLELLPK